MGQDGGVGAAIQGDEVVIPFVFFDRNQNKEKRIGKAMLRVSETRRSKIR